MDSRVFIGWWLLLFPFSGIVAQDIEPGDSLWSVDRAPVFIALDKLEQAYLLLPDGVLEKYSPEGQLIGRFSRRDLGLPTALDVSDPLQVVLWYPDYQTVVVLDRLCTPYQVVRLDPDLFPKPVGVALGRDNQLWIYDAVGHKLYKLNYQGQVLQSSQDLSLWQAPPTEVCQLVADTEGVYLADKTTGIWVFDRLGQYQFRRDLQGVDYLQVLSGGILLARVAGAYLLLEKGQIAEPEQMEQPYAGAQIAVQGKRLLVAVGSRVICFQK